MKKKTIKEEMTLMAFSEYLAKDGNLVLLGSDLIKKFVELENVERYFELMLGVQLEIKVTPVIPRDGRHLGRGLIESISLPSPKKRKK